MDEIKVKSYGLVNFTKRQYVITQTVVFAILIVVLILSYLLDFAKSYNPVIRYLAVGCLVTMILEILETVLMMRKFDEKAMNQEAPE